MTRLLGMPSLVRARKEIVVQTESPVSNEMPEPTSPPEVPPRPPDEEGKRTEERTLRGVRDLPPPLDPTLPAR